MIGLPTDEEFATVLATVANLGHKFTEWRLIPFESYMGKYAVSCTKCGVKVEYFYPTRLAKPGHHSYVENTEAQTPCAARRAMKAGERHLSTKHVT